MTNYIPAPIAARAINLPVHRVYDSIKALSQEFQREHIVLVGDHKWLSPTAFMVVALSVRHIREKVAGRLCEEDFFRLVYEASRKPAGKRSKPRLYVMEMDEGIVKVGFSRNINARARNLSSLTGMEVKRVYSVRCRENPKRQEAGLHHALRQHRIGQGEFFRLDFETAKEFLINYVSEVGHAS